MTEHRFTDAAEISGTRKTADGYLVAEAFAVRTGIQTYAGSEVGLVGRDTVRVWRPEDEVRSPASLQTFSHAPVTLGHPEAVTADNWRNLAKGEVSTEAEWVDGKIKLPLIVKDADAIAAIEAGTRELSAGYTCALEFADGVTPDGEKYDAIQRNIRINHLAIVPKGRAGSECRIGDGADTWGAVPVTVSDAKETQMSDAQKTVVLGDEAVQVSAADAAKIDAYKRDQAKALADAEAKHREAIEAKDQEIGTLKADLKKAKDAAITPDKITKLVADRVALETTVRAIDADIALEGVSDADLRKQAVAKALGDEMVADASEAEIAGMFKAVAKDAEKGDKFADGMKSGVKSSTGSTVADEAYAENITALSTAWMGAAAKKEA